MNKILKGILLGAVIGIIDVTPMIIQHLPWNITISAFSLWVVAGFFVSTSSLKLPNILKGILIPLLLLLATCAWAIGLETLLFPVLPTTLVLGALMGWIWEKIEKK